MKPEDQIKVEEVKDLIKRTDAAMEQLESEGKDVTKTTAEACELLGLSPEAIPELNKLLNAYANGKPQDFKAMISLMMKYKI